MLKEDIQERKVLREKVLSALYDYHFNNNSATYNITSDELKAAPEEKLAYDYLEEKGYIQVTKQGQQYLKIRITANGIDAFENSFLSKIGVCPPL